jgi:hypothetical protein
MALAELLKSLAADLSLAVGGPLAFWLKGLRIPPRKRKGVK